MSQPTVTNASGNNRYEISADGVRAGLTAYVDTADTGGQRIFYHTEVDEQFSGRGLANQLIAAALADTRASGRRIVAMCPFVAAYVDKHDDYDHILDPITPQAHAAVRAAVS